MSRSFPLRLAFVLYIVVELALFVLGIRWLGGGAVFVWVLATGVIGLVLVRREGLRAIETVQAAVRERRAPERTVPDRGMVATGGLLLMLPGLLTDVVGLVMVVPVTRPLAKRLLVVLGVGLINRSGQIGSGTVFLPPSQPSGPAPGPVVQGEVLDSRDDRADPPTRS